MNQKTKLFLQIFHKAQNKFSSSKKRLAGEGWKHDWQTLITTILSAQSRDETTIPIAKALFKKYPTLKSLANAPLAQIQHSLKSINYYKTKSKNVKATAQLLIKKFSSKIPETIEELTTLPGVGRKTANLVITEIHKKPGICVDTHVHRISNVLGLVKTKSPHETELSLQKIAPKKYWSKINRLFVLWGKAVPGRDKKKILNKLEQ